MTRARRDVRERRRSVAARGTPRRSCPAVARVLRVASPAGAHENNRGTHRRRARVRSRDRTRRRERRGVKRTSWGRSQPRWSPCSQRQPGHPWPWCPVSRDASEKAWRVSFSFRDTLAIFRDGIVARTSSDEPLSAARAASRRGRDAAERALIDSRRARSARAPRRRGSARAARVARASGARPAWKIARRSRRCTLTRLGPEALAMMTVCARWERTLTRGWTFTPAKAEVVDIRAAIVLGRWGA